ncbi:MAG: hypothetical protein L3J33_01690 [Rhodobacteraceae bacterium]|nr:hypothetical protein [Paracoccaceae bacterium]
MERIISMIIRRVAMGALRKGLNRSKPNTPAGKTAEQPQSGQQVSQARKLGRLVRRIGRF